MWNLVDANIHILEKLVAHRDYAEICKNQTREAGCPVINFLTDLKKIPSFESYDLSNLSNIYFGEQLRVQFL